VPQYLSERDDPRTTVERHGRQIQWVHCCVTRDRAYYVYHMANEPFEPTTVE
jgi:hypothetical protein